MQTNTFSFGIPIVHTTGATRTIQNITFLAGDIVPLRDRFILELDQELINEEYFKVNLLGTYMFTLDHNFYHLTGTLAMYDRCGNYVREDQLLRAIELRKAGRMRCTACEPNRFRSVLAIDPLRIVLIDCLPHTSSTYIPNCTTIKGEVVVSDFEETEPVVINSVNVVKSAVNEMNSGSNTKDKK